MKRHLKVTEGQFLAAIQAVITHHGGDGAIPGLLKYWENGDFPDMVHRFYEDAWNAGFNWADGREGREKDKKK